MKLSSIVLLVFGVTLALNGIDAIELYSSRYDTIDIDGILSSDRLVSNYVECLLNRRPCPPEGKALKRVLPEALKSKCQRCSAKQKESALKVIRRLHDAYPTKWLELADRYDPTGDYRRSYDEYLRNEQFNSIDGIGSNNERPEKDYVPVLPDIGTRFGFDEPQEPQATNNVQPNNNARPSSNAGSGSNSNGLGNNNQKPAPPVRSVPSSSNGQNTVPTTTRPTPTTNTFPPTTTSTVTQRQPTNRFSTGRPPIFTTHIQGGFQTGPIGSHVLGIVTNLGNKVARTAELFAGMLKDTVHVIVG